MVSTIRVLALALSLFVSGHLVAEQKTNLHLGGTGAATGAMKILANQFAEQASHLNIKVFPSLGSGGGVRALLAGKLHMSFTSRPLKESERAQDLQAHPIIETPFVFVTHAGVTEADLTLSEIADIYSGKRTHWDNGQLIRPVLRPLNDADSKIVMNMSAALKDALQIAHNRTGKNVAATDFDGANELERIEGAFGTTTTLLIKAENRHLHIPTLDGIAPTTTSYRDGTYPFGKTIYAILPPNPSLQAKAFLDFLRSTPAQSIILELDALPVAAK